MAQAMTETHTGATSGGDVRRVQLDWTSASDGSVSIATSTAISGEIVRVIFKPGSVTPTTLYDVTLLDAAGMDVLAGQGANLANNATTNVCPGVPLKDGTTTSVGPMVVNDVLTLTVANAGDTKTGSVILFLR